MLDIAEASARILGAMRTVGDEETAVADGAGRVLAQDVRSEIALPPWDNSGMDGYAVRAADIATASADAPTALRVTGTIAAGDHPANALGAGEAIRIMTGAPVPAGADSVVRVEDTDGGTATVRVRSARDAGRNVRPRGEDVAAGDVVAAAGTRINGSLLALLAAVGCARLSVARRPIVALVGSGDELTTVDRFDEVRRGNRIVGTNGYALSTIVREAGGEVLDLGIASDDREQIRAKMLEGASKADLVVTTAGVSVGEHDHTKSIVEELGRVEFWRISARPGSQLASGTIGTTPWLGLPGNPVSAAIAGELFVRPAVLRLQGVRDVHRAPIRVRLGAPVRGAPAMTLLLRARLVAYPGGFVAELTGPQGSGLLSSMARADAILVIPPGVDELPAGTPVDALPLHGAVAMSTTLDLTPANRS
ncbi:MAG: gephyrin-like molybdotransferase Glp [Gemmatimonadaceae bacterium]